MNREYVVIGFSKCGITSLKKYLNCANPEIAYNDNGVEEYLKNYSDMTPCIITRDPVDRIWSAYNYFPFFSKMTFQEFLDFRSPQWQGVGCNDIIEACNYEKYIDRFRPYGVKVFKLEEMMNRDDFPKFNEKKHEPIPDEYRQLIEQKLINSLS